MRSQKTEILSIYINFSRPDLVKLRQISYRSFSKLLVKFSKDAPRGKKKGFLTKRQKNALAIAQSLNNREMKIFHRFAERVFDVTHEFW
jgi:hypothetical protein